MDLLLLYDLTALKKFADVRSGIDLTLVGTYLMNLRLERFDAAVVSLERHRSDLVCPVGKSLSLDQ